jgi:hypothetical protein
MLIVTSLDALTPMVASEMASNEVEGSRKQFGKTCQSN